MKRRKFIALLGGAVTASPLVARAQQRAKVPRIGFLFTAPFGSPEFLGVFEPFREGMRDLGYVEGQNFTVEFRSADGKQDRFASLAIDLVRVNVDLIVAAATPHARAAQQATRTIPIVVPVMADPVADGLVASLARPGGNITGLTSLGGELTSKRLDLLKQALPGLSSVAVLWHPGATSERTASETLKATEAAAASLGLRLRLVDVRGADDIDGASTLSHASGLRPCSWPRARCYSLSGDASQTTSQSTGCRRSSMPGSMRRLAASCPTGRALPIGSGAAQRMWTKY